jgi:drug/metabolite transporter (DMT)-like permease
MPRSLYAHLALSTVALIYGANYIIAKSVMPHPIGPNSFIALRVFGATLCFWLVAFRKITLPRREDIGRFVLCAATGVAVNQLLFFNGLSLTSPLNSSIIMTSNPILVMVISSLLLKQSIQPKKIIGLFLGASGAILLLLLSAQDHTSLSNPWGDLAILINSLSYAFYLVLVKPLMEKYSAFTVITWVFSIGLLLVLPFGGSGAVEVPWKELTLYQWFSVFYVIAFVTFLTYLLNILALRHVSPTTASAYIYFQPMLALVFSFLFTFFTPTNYMADFTWAKVGCALCIFLGVYLTISTEKRNSV